MVWLIHFIRGNLLEVHCFLDLILAIAETMCLPRPEHGALEPFADKAFCKD